MSDIRSFFSGNARKPKPKSAETIPNKRTKRRVVDISDDEDDEIVEVVPKSAEKEKLEDVEVSEYFGNKAPKRQKEEIKDKPKIEPKAEPESKSKTRPKDTDVDYFDDDDGFDDMDFEEIEIISKPKGRVKKEVIIDTPARKPAPNSVPQLPSPSKVVSKSPAKAKVAEKHLKSPQKKASSAVPVSIPPSGITAEEVLSRIPDAHLPDAPTTKLTYTEIKARQSAAPQSSLEPIEIPEAEPNCLAGLTFVFTGILPRLARETAQDLVKKYGAKVTTSPSRNTSCVVLGAEAGPSKIANIKRLKIKAIDEEGLIQLIREMPRDGGSGAAALKAVGKQAAELEQARRQADVEMSEASVDVKNSGKKGEKGKSSPAATNAYDLWTTKYAPKTFKDICGNKSAVEKLSRWLHNWSDNARHGFKNPGADGSGIFRAAIIHGPPGIGKTTAAHIVANEAGYDVLESNASDTRSKSLLASQVTGTLSNTSLAGWMSDIKAKTNLCMVMDEVDGMSAGDRGGVGQMAALCRSTEVPIILICNERNLPKMRPFDKVTWDVPFRRPDANMIRSRIMTIAYKEGIEISATAIDALVQSTHSDIRQIINMLSTFSRTNKTIGYEDGKALSKSWEKHTALKPFDIIAKFLSSATFSANSNMSLNDKIELYFEDHDFAPLMVQENYLSTMPTKTGSHLQLAGLAAESISDGDLIDRKIHGSQQQWGLMPLHGVLSCVRPCYYVSGQGRARYNFTSYLGNNSKAGKSWRILQEVQAHARLRISGDKVETRLQYLPLWAQRLLGPLKDQGSEGINDVIQVMNYYYLTREDWDGIMDLGVGPANTADKAKSLPTQVKSAFTRKYNAESHPVPFMRSNMAPLKAAKAEVPDLEETVGEEVEEEVEEEKDEDNDLSKDKYIKIPKAKAKPKAGAKPKAAKASSSKGKSKKPS